MNIKKWSLNWGGRELSIEMGRLALLSTVSCTAQYGETVVMVNVTKSSEEKVGLDYFPLTVDFEEKMYAAGRIKGSRFVKREGRPSDDAVLSGRLIDRAIRPLFDDRTRNEVQVVVTTLAFDGENDPAIVGLIGASCALAVSSIPWDGPIAAARVSLDEKGEFILNLGNSQVEGNVLDLVVAGTPDKLVMTEAAVREVSENKVVEAMKWGCQELQPVIDFINKIQAEVGKEKISLVKEGENPSADAQDKEKTAEQAKQTAKDYIASLADSKIFNSVKISRTERVEMVDEIKHGLVDLLTEQGFEEDLQKPALDRVKEYVCEQITKRILDKNQRLDGRKLDEIRNLEVEVDLLPRVHGSGMFMRGDTQVLSIVTLGAPGDVQTLDSMEEEGTKRYMHHYNDAPYSYGETGRIGGLGRRAIGHGALAERALEPVLPEEENFPYAIRVVSEVLGSNGSSSMASTCGSSLSLMAAGVPIKKPVAGIAMGLASEMDEKYNIKNWKVLTDLQDVEDGVGGMDFKITGTSDGVTAIQMDTKTHGLTWEIVEETFKRSKDARLEILKKMSSVIAEPRKELSPYAPRIETVRIDPEKIGDLIGPGGKTIKKITEETGVSIDIEQDGRVLVTSVDAEAMKKAIKIINDITHEVTAGEIYEGEVVRLEDFGAFVQILPGQDGLVHVSEIDWNRVGRPGDILNLGDKVKVQVKEIDNLGRINLSIKALKPKPEGYVPPAPFVRDGGGRSFDRGGRGNDRGGDRKRGGFFKRDR